MFKLFRFWKWFSIIGKGNSCDILYNLSNILAARLGVTPMAAFQFCLQFWMTSSLLSDGLAIAGQIPKLHRLHHLHRRGKQGPSSTKRRRDRINEKMRALQELIPNCNK